MEQKFSSMDHDSLGRVGEGKNKNLHSKKTNKKKVQQND